MAYRMLHSTNYLNGDRDVNVHRAVVKDHYGMHTHDFIEMVLITSGMGIHTVGDESYPLKKGDMFILNANVPHAYTAVPESPLTVYNCLFQPAAIDAALGDGRDFIKAMYGAMFHSFADFSGAGDYIKLQTTSALAIEILFNEIYNEYQRKESGYTHMVRADLIKLLIYTFREYQSSSRNTGYSPAYQRAAVEMAISYMQEHYMQNLTNDQLASLSYMSVPCFCRVFKRETGMSAFSMLQKIRIERAIKLLLGTDRTIEDIMERVGYSDRKNFYAIFRRQTGTTPGDYRNRRE